MHYEKPPEHSKCCAKRYYLSIFNILKAEIDKLKIEKN
jgi:hypothetical protein